MIKGVLISKLRVGVSRCAQFSQQSGIRARLLKGFLLLAMALEEGATISGMIKPDSSN
jgi:hypothetical protein